MVFQHVGRAFSLFQNASTTGLTTAWTWAQDNAAKIALDSRISSVVSENIAEARALYQHATTAVTWAQDYPVKDTLDSLTPSMVSDKALVLYQSVHTTSLAEFATTGFTRCATTAVTLAKDHPVGLGLFALNLVLSSVLGPGWLPALALRGLGFEAGGVVAGRFHWRWYSISYYTH